MAKRSGKSSISKGKIYEDMDYVQLINTYKGSTDPSSRNSIFLEIERRMKDRIRYTMSRYNIPGSRREDIYQECLYALVFKAIKDYDPERGNGTGPFPFEVFADLCIVRHLSTKSKSNYQKKNKVWMSTVSLDQSRGDVGDDNLFLVDIIPETEGNLLEEISKNDYAKTVLKKIYEKLSPFEQKVFLLFLQKNSYSEICDKLYKKLLDIKQRKRAVKSIDNAIMRIKTKAKTIKQQYGK